MSISQPLSRLVRIKVGLRYTAISIPNPPPKQKKKRKKEKGEAKKEKVFRNCNLSAGLNCQDGTKQGIKSETLVHCRGMLFLTWYRSIADTEV